jgi:hypothetical protein
MRNLLYRLGMRKHDVTPGWYYHRCLGFLQVGGWCYCDWRHPVWTARWWWEHAVTYARRRGWRWD